MFSLINCFAERLLLISPELAIVDLGSWNRDEVEELGKKWTKVIQDAQSTPQGRARIALAVTIGQWPAWGGPGKAPVAQPDPSDVKALQESMYESVVKLIPSNSNWGTTMIEYAGRGQVRSNASVDYKQYYNNGNVSYKNAVEELYRNVGLTLDQDLESINEFPRIESGANAIKYWSAPGRTHVGEPKVPLLRIHTIGDGLVYPTMA